MRTPTSRHLRHVAVALAAATAVVLGPTACDIGIGAADAASGPGGASAPVAALPVAAESELDTDTEDAEETGAEETEAEEAEETDGPDASAAAEEDDTDDAGESGTAEATPDADEAGDDGDAAATTGPAEETAAAATTTAPAAPPAAGGLETLGSDCTGSELEPHDGFQNAPRCVSTAFGEVASEDRSPSLLITDSPTEVAAGEAFDLQVSTRNLVRDRFLGAAAGGYYRESSFLNEEGIQRGHFHTACRLLPDLDVAPDAAPVPAFFLATQDNGGGSEPDQVTVPVPGLDEPGTYQCSVWAGDGSHRLPMMQRANQTPAFDIVRVEVT